MENIISDIKILGLVTLYNPKIGDVAGNISSYLHNVDTLIVWDNTPEAKDTKDILTAVLGEDATRMVYHTTGKNVCIAPAINHAWHYAVDNGYDMLLIMDQDSRWNDFEGYRRDIERLYCEHKDWVFTPYVNGCDIFEKTQEIEERRLCINSGTVIPTSLLTAIGGADELFPLDALDHDLAIRLQKEGARVVCLTKNELSHSMGNPPPPPRFGLTTPDYGPFRTYSMARSHLLCLRKHWRWMLPAERWYTVKYYVIVKFVTIIIIEKQKLSRLWSLIKGVAAGLFTRVEG